MVTNNDMLSDNTTKTAQQESFQAEVDQSSRNLNTNPLYCFEQEDDEAYLSNDDNEDIIHVDDESGLNWDDGAHKLVVRVVI